jgi:hypothetical protein
MKISARLIAFTPALLVASAQAQLVFAPASDSPPIVGVGTPTGTVRFFTAFEPTFRGGVNVAMGDVNGDGAADIIVGAGPGGGPHVKVMDGASLAPLRTFTPFGNSYLGATYVASGVIMGDRTPDIIVSADRRPADGPHVRVFDGRTGWMLYAIDPFPGFNGGVRIAAADLDGDGFDDIISAPDHTHPNPTIKVHCGRTLLEVRNIALSGSMPEPPTPGGGSGDDILIGGITSYGPGQPGTILYSTGDGHTRLVVGTDQGVWQPFGPSYTGGLSVAAGDVDGDGRPDLIAGMLNGGRVASIAVDPSDPTSPMGAATFMEPYGTDFTGGIFVGAAPVRTCPSADINGDGDIGTDADIEAFFACLAGDCCNACGTADFNRDGDVGTDADIEAFFRVLGGGGC